MNIKSGLTPTFHKILNISSGGNENILKTIGLSHQFVCVSSQIISCESNSSTSRPWSLSQSHFGWKNIKTLKTQSFAIIGN